MFEGTFLHPGRVLSRDVNHLYIAPHPALAAWVAHYTLTFPSGGVVPVGEGQTLTLLPDASGCFVFQGGGAKTVGLFWGATTKAVTIEKDFEEVPERFFVEFRPGGAHKLTGMAMAELADSRLALDEVYPALYREIRLRMEHSATLQELVDGVDEVPLGLATARDGFDGVAPLLALLPGMQDTTTPVRDLADKTGYSERHLSRLFRQSVGLSVKAYARVYRINHVLARLGPGVSLTRLAQEAGYYDQAHFNHEFKAVCGVSPSRYLANMSEFYKEEYKF